MARNLDEMVLKTAVAHGLIDREVAKGLYRECQKLPRPAAELLVERKLVSANTIDDIIREAQRHLEPKVIGGFQIDSRLGNGGMGAVYRATQLSIGRTVALKVLSPQVAKSPGFRERFLREARAMGAINHPNVVTCHDAGEDNGVLYMALELMTGGDADALAAKSDGRLSPRRACQVVRDATAGLMAIQKAGLIHRDIKPANIFLTADGSAKLADLGLARQEDGDDRMTRTGAAVGTPAFMSPEQAQGADDVDIRSDIYALGATLFALVTGEPPYTGPSVYAVVAKVINDPPPDPRSLCPDLPGPLCDLISRCLAKDRTKRPQSPQELHAALCGITERLSGDGRNSQRRSAAGIRGPVSNRLTPITSAVVNSRLPLVLGILAAALAIGAVGAYIGFHARVPESDQSSPPPTPTGGKRPTSAPTESTAVIDATDQAKAEAVTVSATAAPVSKEPANETVRAPAPVPLAATRPAVASVTTDARPPVHQPIAALKASTEEPKLKVEGLRWHGDPALVAAGNDPLSRGTITGSTVGNIYGRLLRLDGRPANISAPISRPLVNWTISAMVNLDGASNNGGIIALVAPDRVRCIGIAHLADGGFAVATADGRRLTPTRLSGGDGSWFHVALTDDGQARHLYVNGVAVSSDAGGMGFPAGGTIIAGGPWTSRGESVALNGLLGDPLLFDRALQASEIQAVIAWSLRHAAWERDRRNPAWTGVLVHNSDFDNAVGAAPRRWTCSNGATSSIDPDGNRYLRFDQSGTSLEPTVARQEIVVDKDWSQIRLRARLRLNRPLALMPPVPARVTPPAAGIRLSFDCGGPVPVVRHLSGRLMQGLTGSWFEVGAGDGWPVPAKAQRVTIECILNGATGSFDVDDVRLEVVKQ